MGVRCFYLEKTDRTQRSLRRYAGTHDCCTPFGYHDACFFLDVVTDAGNAEEVPCKDPRWPTKCEHCDYVFAMNDAYQTLTRCLYRRLDTGEEMTLDDAGPGAMWNGEWMLTEGSNRYRGPDGICLIAKLPNGDSWLMDGPASNCARPGEDHKCWVRHGVPPNITVDKDGDTCAAGSGSIQSNDYHGFLVNGEFAP